MNTTAVVHQPINSDERQSLNVLYQVTAADLVFFKQQQWTVMNYSVGLDTAIVVIAHQLIKGPLTPVLLWALLFLTCAIPAVSLLAMKRLHRSIAARRTRMDQTRALLGSVFQQAWEVPKEPDDLYFVFLGVLFSSWLVTLWLVLPQ